MKRSVIIPAAGLASRMKPLSRGVSKAMIPVNGRPLISYIIEHLKRDLSITDEIIIVENELGDIQEFVKRVYPGQNITFVTQEEKLGPLHAINLGYQYLQDWNTQITIWLGDTICLDDFDWDSDFVAVHSVPDPHRWCLIDRKGNLYDKPDMPVPTNSALVGVYHFTHSQHFKDAITDGMNYPQHKGEHQIAALLTEYQLIHGAMDLSESVEWYDCGELNTYYESKARLLKRTARSFNKIEVDTFLGTVTKSSSDEDKQKKIELEKTWFTRLSEKQSLFCPRIITSDRGTLVMSLEPGTALNEVLVYDNLRADAWNEIIRKIIKVHQDVFYTEVARKPKDIKLACFESYYLKNSERITDIVAQFGDNGIKKFVEDVSLEMCKDPIWSGVLHGDSHLGNIIYDPHSGNIKFVDPRGSFGNITGTEGDIRYDYGKLLQDFYCGYAMMMADRFTIINDKYVDVHWVGDTHKICYFLENILESNGYDVKLLKKLAIVLLVTAIPFHSDNLNRQKAFYFRALNLIETL